MIISKTWLYAAAALSALVSTTGAEARSWIVSAGVKATTAPPYEGSDVYVIRPAPTLTIRPADRPYRFIPPDDGVTAALIVTDHFEIGPIVRFRSKRKNTGDLVGMDPIKWAVEPGAFIDIWPTSWLRLRGEVRRGFGGHKGVLGDVGADLVYMSPKWDFSIGPRAGWGDKEYLTEYFGVTPLEATRSPTIKRAYAPGAGRRSAGGEVAGAYHYNERLRILGSAGYSRLAGKAGDSPIVAMAGSRNQFLASLGVSYSFTVGR